MFPVLKPFIALYSAVLFMMTGLGLLNSYLSLRLSIEGVSTQMVSVVLTSYFIGLVVGTFVCKRMISSVGHIRSFAAFTAIATAMVMMHGLYISVPFWACLRFITGVSSMGLFMVIESWLNECADSQVRARVFSVYMIMGYLGGTIGQKFLNAGDAQSQTLYLVVGIFLVLGTVPVALTHSIHPELPRIEQISLKTIWRKSPIGIMGCFVAGLTNSAFYTMGPVFAHQIKLTVSQMSWFMALTVLGGLLLQWPVGTFSDRFDRSLVLPSLGLIVSAICIFIVLATRNSFGMLLVATTVFGGFIFTVYPVAVARAHDMFDAQDVVKVSSALLLSFGVGAVLGPLFASTVMILSGTPYGFYFYLIGVSSLYALITMAMRQKEGVQILPAEEQVDFVMMKKTSDVVMHMDPRQDIKEDVE